MLWKSKKNRLCYLNTVKLTDFRLIKEILLLNGPLDRDLEQNEGVSNCNTF